MDNSKLNNAVKDANDIAAGNYKEHEPTARNHAKLQALQIAINSELIRTIRHLDTKNSKLQKQVAILSIIATVASIIALFK